MRSDFLPVHWGDIIALEYGKGLKGYRERTHGYRVFGTNGPVGWNPKPLCPHAGVVVGRKGAYRGVHYSCEPFYVIDTAYWVRPLNDRVDLKWAYYALRLADINGRDSGSAIPSTSRGDVYTKSVPFPSLEEQRRIAAVLGALDDKIELNRKMNQTLEEMAQAIFKSWFIDFDGHDPADLVDSELGPIPRGWEVRPIGEWAKIVGGGTPSTKVDEYWEPPTYCWTTPKDLSNAECLWLLSTARKLSEEGISKVSSGLLPRGTFLLSSRAPVGYTALASMPLAVNQGYIAIPPQDKVSTSYLLFWSRENLDVIKARAGGTTFAEISKRNFRPIPIIVPESGVLSRFDQTTAPLLAKIEMNAKQGRVLADIRDTLLPKLISGEIRVPEAEEQVEAAL
jgi:type I restriction enzyme S subunit